MTIALTSSISHPTDTQARLSRIGINYDNQRVIFDVTLAQTGEVRRFFVGSEPGDIDTIAGLVATFPGFGNLRNNLESYIAAKVAALAGNVS